MFSLRHSIVLYTKQSLRHQFAVTQKYLFRITQRKFRCLNKMIQTLSSQKNFRWVSNRHKFSVELQIHQSLVCLPHHDGWVYHWKGLNSNFIVRFDMTILSISISWRNKFFPVVPKTQLARAYSMHVHMDGIASYIKTFKSLQWSLPGRID